MTSIPGLDDDIFLVVFSFLDRKDALAVSSCAKRLYYVAIPEAFRSFNVRKNRKDEGWSHPDKALKASACSDLLQRKASFYNGVHRGRHLHRLALRMFSKRDFLHFPVLLAAPDRLQTFYPGNLESLLREHSRVAEDIGNMTELKQVILREVGPWTMERLQAMLSAQKLTSKLTIIRHRKFASSCTAAEAP
ncbi:uncharacterized protein BXZ73DRAFT_109739 [Epithele typhae]|uniref:uncharacterized protein n=1 Tax=Epithele typhae TaxID=378194 RepID=UPI0020087DA7|nr:uncharacterized protein BXZ73DRAFT_111565 [Epithele typhae]XP_047870712.1 uncharacterized protein BXZ73DRAFT_109739 [Epithele typhae]KAH9900659.1 hypothetical protein BXZ73DRAFT_111565 [Epithele typhae]KAH9908834.1 hypothetical protein BXZ73DRAFT_109739 [Epithele typhae]